MSCIKAPESEVVLRRIVEDSRLVLNRPGCESVNLPLWRFPRQSNAVETEWHIRPFPQVDDSTGAEAHLLAPNAYRTAYIENTKKFLDKVDVEWNLPILEWGTT
jgi:hypothetical protein